MKASDFTYQKPATLAAALDLLQSTDAQVLAGGQSLMPMMNFRMATPKVLVDLNAIDALNYITEHSDIIEIGAMTRYAQLLHSSLISTHIPLLTQAIPFVAHSAIRNRGTIGGSAALADPAAEIPALLKALNAELLLTSTHGERRIAADDFFTGIYETQLADNEIIKSITIPKAGSEHTHGFYEVTRRHGDYAMAGVAITAKTAHPLLNSRVVFFGVGEKALRALDCEQVLEGCDCTDESAINKAIETLASLEFIDDHHATSATRQHLSGVVLQRALRTMS